MTPEIVPLELSEARAYVQEHHRHSDAPIGHRFSIGLECDGELLGVAIAGRPVARGADDGRTLEITRLATTGSRNACSRLYSAACRAAFAMGYRRVITYTLAEEDGASLRAAGFRPEEDLPARGETWNWSSRPGRAMEALRMWDPPRVIDAPRRRWVRP